MTKKKQLVPVLIGCGGLLLAGGCGRPIRSVPMAEHIPAPSPKPIDGPAALPRATQRPASEPVTMHLEPAGPVDPGSDTDAKIRNLLAAIQDAYFDYDRYELRPDAIAALQKNVAVLNSILRDRPDLAVIMEGHCDERGSAEYNLGLADQRAQRAREFLIQLGVPATQLRVISFGKERPQCTESSEDCWQKNRRAHLAPSL